MSTGKGSKPDLVILDGEIKTIALLQLTWSLPGSASKAHTLKDTRNTKLSIDLKEKRYKVIISGFQSTVNWSCLKQRKHPKHTKSIQN